MNNTRRYSELDLKLASAETTPREIAELGSEYSRLSNILVLEEQRSNLLTSIKELKILIADESGKGTEGEEMAALAKMELEGIEEELNDVENKIIDAIIPRDEADNGGVVLEVRAGTGA